jgi:hypothetical protein
MAALQPALSPALSAGQDNGAQQIGVEGRDKGDVGAPAVEPSWAEGPLLGSFTPNTAPSVYTGLDYLDGEAMGVPVDRTPFPYNQGDPDRPADLSDDHSILTAQAGHDWDQGAPAANRFYGNPDIGKPVLQHYQMESTERQPVFTPEGYMVETPGSRTANVANWFNDQAVNVGIGYYALEDERPLYRQLAQVPAGYGGPGGLYQPDNRYSDTIYNDAGIPDAWVSPPDAPVNQYPVQVQAADDYYGVS